jgi:hypothetical protein
MKMRDSWIDPHSLPTGGPDPILYLLLNDDKHTTIRPKTGLSATSDYRAYYLDPQQHRPAPIKLVPGPVDGEKCGFWEIDRQLMPGLYGLQVPTHLRNCGYTYVYLCFAGARVHYLELHGIEYDRQDAFALGLTTWIRSTCHEHLTSGLRKSMPATLRPLLQDWFYGGR